MKKIMFLLLSFTLFAPSVMAAEVEIKWTEPDKYSDIHEGENHRKNFRKQIFTNFEKHFSKLASQLPEGQILKVEVTNVDLAGTTFHSGINRIRVIKDMYPPRMKFSYQLLNTDNSIAVEGEADLKDINYMMGRSLRYRSDTLGYEKGMLDKWFAEIFKPLIEN